MPPFKDSIVEGFSSAYAQRQREREEKRREEEGRKEGKIGGGKKRVNSRNMKGKGPILIQPVKIESPWLSNG